ncbi:MAG: hypothetical protein H6707_20630 [Deltaproteobacteria bacterium]|nr:hypothetical protein [Planctomycetales bacterium]MCB9558535.1 hypothetical protein [Deltaproteobacteria bacterium]
MTYLATITKLARALLIFPLVLVVFPDRAEAKIFFSKQGALKVALPAAKTVVPRDIFLSDEQAAEIKAHSGRAPQSKLLRVYVGEKDGAITGYALIDTVIIRTLPATMMYVLTPTGQIRAIHVLAFHEPLEYRPPQRWLSQFYQRPAHASSKVAGIAGATLTAQVIAQRAAAALELFRVAINPQKKVALGPNSK